MKLTNIVFCLMLLGGGLTSCIREDLDDCFSTNKLVLSYKGDGDKEIFPDKICRVEMYVFNAENQCVNSSVLPEDQVKSRTALLPPLEAGEYRIICLGNTHHTKVDRLDAGDYGQMRFAAEDYLAGNTVSGNDSLYYASTPLHRAEVHGTRRGPGEGHRIRQLPLRPLGGSCRSSRYGDTRRRHAYARNLRCHALYRF